MDVKFKWSGKSKRTCRVNGVIIGSMELVEHHVGNYASKSWRWNTRFSNCYTPNFDSIDEGVKRIEAIFIKWLKGVVD